MTLVRRTIEKAVLGVRVSNSADGLSALHHPGCAAVIWQRNVAPEVSETLASIDPHVLPSTRAIVRPGSIRHALEIVCDDAEPEHRATLDWLVDDIITLAARFTGLMHPPYLRLRLEIVTTDACRKFHVDAVTARLICTYRGTGTQCGISVKGAEPKRVITVPTGAPIILRGTKWPATPASGLLHRSPPINRTGESRLLLVLDLIFELTDEI
ncbi:MAG: DUF1826 domain-containing protein [Gammaproteobacteria bacterium]|nr:DUF1826 domain-containing protein [Gammaproteobacteria bacterium]